MFMESVIKSLWVGFGAFIGANARFWLGEIITHRAYPWATFAINVSGSLAIGIFYAWEMQRNPHSVHRLFWAVGLCGGFTTFSAFSWEALRMIEKGSWLALGTYVFGSVVTTIAACALGFVVSRSILAG